ncbi:MAG: TetR/AcrR family transcriptional regulator [Anaerolineales bacterium]
MTEKTPPRQLIIEAVVTCIEKYGIDKITTRKIAEEAGTNIASINYYFRSKDDLITEALTTTINHMTEDIFATIDDLNKPFETVMQEAFFYLIDGGLRFPGISTAHLYSAVIEKRYDSPGAQGINKAFDHLVKRTVQEYPQKDPEYLRFVLSRIFYSIFLIMLAPDFLTVAEKYRLTNSENSKTLAEQYTRMFLAAI